METITNKTIFFFYDVARTALRLKEVTRKVRKSKGATCPNRISQNSFIISKLKPTNFHQENKTTDADMNYFPTFRKLKGVHIGNRQLNQHCYPKINHLPDAQEGKELVGPWAAPLHWKASQRLIHIQDMGMAAVL